jgi:HD superfamily phosphohydrolase YqeK
VATHCKRLYRQNAILKFREKEAYYAGLLHDNAKYISDRALRKYLGTEYKDIPTKALHGFYTQR